MGLLLKLEKYEFNKKEVNFLRYIVTTSGIKVSPKKVKAIKEWPILYNIKLV